MKIILLFICILNLSSALQDINWNNGEELPQEVKTDETFHVILGKKDYFLDYLDITLKSPDDQKVNPFIIASIDEDCESNRLYMGTQIHGSIQFFLRLTQIPENSFYICIKSRKLSDDENYSLILKNDNQAKISYDTQTSYYVSDNNLESMKFSFQSGYSSNEKVTIWIKGKSIEKPDFSGNLNEEKFDFGYLYYGNLDGSNVEITVKSHKGDFVTVGSVIITNRITKELKTNDNEIMIATDEEVCIPIEINTNILSSFPHINGKVYTKKAISYFTDENNRNKIERDGKTDIMIENGIIDALNIFVGETISKGHYCLLSNLQNKELIIFSIQMTSNSIQLVHPPLLPGEIHRHYLTNGEYAIFYGMKPDDDAKEVNLVIKSLEGYPEMYFDNCQEFPYCTYNEDSVGKLTNPQPSNKITVYSFYMDEDEGIYKTYNPISSFQPLIIIHCEYGEEIPDNMYCIFETSYFSNKDTVYLDEDSTFSQYLLDGEEDKYRINLLGEENKMRLYIDLMIFSGDADLNIPDFDGEANKYYLSNKIFYSVHLDKNTKDALDFNVKANTNTFYMLQYQLMDSVNKDKNIIESGVNYITSKSIDAPNLSKYLELLNFKRAYKIPYLATFYSPNCILNFFKVGETTEALSVFNQSAQVIIDPGEEERYTFYYEIEKTMYEYGKKNCMAYVAGLELTNGQQNLGWKERAISLSEGVPHRYTYSKKYPYISYAYHVSDTTKTLVMNFNLINKADFEVKINIGKTPLPDEIIYRNKQLYLNESDFDQKCELQEVCTITVNIHLTNSEQDKVLEFTMYQIDNTPFYLEKNLMKSDILHGNKVKHYYFEIGNEEYGDITLDFKRGSGNIYASVVERELNQPMDNPEWRGLYHFPTTNDESLKYDTYVKKIIIGETDTEKCNNGCYVLISIISNIDLKGEYDDIHTPYRISIIPRINHKNDTYYGNPEVLINVNEFIIGNIKFTTSENKYDYYIVNLQYDSDVVYFDWQADSPILLINVGAIRPTEENHDFQKGDLHHDYVYELTKEDILSKVSDKTINSLSGLNLTMGIFSNKMDSLQSSPYAFKIFMPPKGSGDSDFSANIIHIRSDQKVQCKPFDYNGNNICVFAVIFDEMDLDNSLVLYPKSEATKMEIYGSEVEAENIERNDIEEIQKIMDNIFTDKKEEFKINDKYIFIEKIEKGKSYFLIVNENDNKHIIEILSSTYKFTQESSMFPNPSTPQIFAVKNTKINLNFATTKDLLLNIVSLDGEGFFYWGGQEEGTQQKYYLNGFEDRLSLTSYTENEEEKLAALYVEADNKFIFYITYYPRSSLDQLKADRTTEINYRTVLMPLYFYAPINILYSWSVNFNFYDFNLEHNDDIIYDKTLFNIWAKVVTEEEVSLARFDPSHLPKRDDDYYEGVFDSSFGTIYLYDLYDKYAQEQNNLFICIEKASNIKYNFTSMGLELSIYSDYISDGYNYVPEGVYLNGKLSKVNDKTLVYLLYKEESKKYLMVEYNSNSDYIQFALTTNRESKQTDRDGNYFIVQKEEDENGRHILIIQLNDNIFSDNKNLYFVVYTNEEEIDSKLDNYVFKYLSAEGEDYFISILDKSKSDITVDIHGSNYKISFSPITEYKDVSYYIKAIYKDEEIQGEKIDTIAISESPGKYMQINYPQYTEGSQLSYDFHIDNKEISYIKVMARVKDQAQKYFLLYTPKKIEQGDESDELIITTDENQFNIDYQSHIKAKAENVPKIKKYKLNFSNSMNSKLQYPNLPNYIKIYVSPNTENNNPILYSSLDDEECKNNRIQLSKGEIWIKKEQINNQNYLNFVVECTEQGSICSYSLEISESTEVIFDSLTTYSYYVNDYNQEMIFKFRNEFESNGDILTMYATGTKDIKLSIEDCWDTTCDQHDFSEGSAITTSTREGQEYFTLTVSAPKNSYITVGAKVIGRTGKSIGNVLIPENGLIYGFLRKGILEKECYILPTDKNDIYYITGTLYNSLANITYLDDDSIEIDLEIARKGFFSSIYNYEESKRRYICIGFLDFNEYEEESFSYSIQIQSKSSFKNNYSPQYTGYIYPRIIPTNNLAYFTALPPKVDSDRIVYNMITLKGYPKMFLYECTTYPSCELNYDDLENTQGVERVSEINRMSTFSKLNKKVSPIDANQELLIVKCINSITGTYDNCQFMTSIFGEKEEVTLIEYQPFSQYILAGDKDKFLIDFSQEKRDIKIHIDFLVVSGDVSFELKNGENENDNLDKKVNKYYLANKIFYSLTRNETSGINSGLKKILVEVSSRIHSYYIMQYRIIKDEADENTNELFSTIDYLIPIFVKRNDNTKDIILSSVDIIKPESFIVTFYSLNCDLGEVTYNSEDGIQPNQFGDYAQQFYEVDDDYNQFNSLNTYTVKVTMQEKYALTNKDMCMIYIAGLEIYPEDSNIRKEILLSEGVPHKVIFEQGLKRMRYIYPHANPEKNITVGIRMYVQGKFKVKLFFREQSYNQEETYTQTSIIYIRREWINEGCRENELCSITVELDLIETFHDDEPIIETIIKQVKNEPYYLPRGDLGTDFVSGEAYLFIYSDIGQNEGYVTINFYRGSGYIYAKVAEINQASVDNDPDWRHFHFPRTVEESLYYDFYNKKILFKEKDTNICQTGCYLLISIKTSVIKKLLLDSEFQYFSLVIDYSPKDYEAKGLIQRKIVVEPEEYVIGSLYNENINSNLEYYSITIPYNCTGIEIDWQSDTAILLINIGGPIPDVDMSSLKYEERSDTNIFIPFSKVDEIYNTDPIEGQIFDIGGIELLIGVYTKYYDSLDSTVYSFRAHFPQTELNIYKVFSDQKTICRPEKLDDYQYRCLFVVIYEEFQFLNDLVIYARSQASSAITDMYADYLDNEIYDSYNSGELIKRIPNEKSEFSTKKNNTNFIFLNYGDFKKNVYVSVISDRGDFIEFYTSMLTFENKLSPNPSTTQIYSLDLAMKDLTVDFITTKSIAINIISIYGQANIHLEKDQQLGNFFLRGRDDSLELMVPEKQGPNTAIIVENLNYQENPDKNYPGFIFLIEFKKRSTVLNFDELKSEELSEFSYQDGDFPVYYFSKIFDKENSINVFFYLHDVIYEDHSTNFNREMTSNELEFKGVIREEDLVYSIREDPSKVPEFKIKGVYDPTLLVGNIMISADDIKKVSTNKPTLYLGIEKSDKIKNINFNGIRGEIGFSTINGDSPAVQKLYIFGKVQNYQSINSYLLRAEQTTKYMRIQFSCNSKYVNFALAGKPDVRKNMTLTNLEKKVERGILFLTFEKPTEIQYLYLNIFLAQDSKNEKLNNYMFKYINANKKEDFYEYKIVGNDGKIEKINTNGKAVKISFNPIDYQNMDKISISIVYIIKLVDSKNYVADENANMLSVTESGTNARQYKSDLTEEKINIDISDFPDDIKYIQVISRIKQGSIIEYVSYDAIDSSGAPVNDPDPVNIIEPEPSPGPGPEPHPSDQETDEEDKKKETDEEDKKKETDKTDKKKEDDNAGLYVIIGVSSFLFVVVIILVIVIVMYNSKNKDLMTQVNKISFVQSGASEAKDDGNLLLNGINDNELD